MWRCVWGLESVGLEFRAMGMKGGGEKRRVMMEKWWLDIGPPGDLGWWGGLVFWGLGWGDAWVGSGVCVGCGGKCVGGNCAGCGISGGEKV